MIHLANVCPKSKKHGYSSKLCWNLMLNTSEVFKNWCITEADFESYAQIWMIAIPKSCDTFRKLMSQMIWKWDMHHNCVAIWCLKTSEIYKNWYQTEGSFESYVQIWMPATVKYRAFEVDYMRVDEKLYCRLCFVVSMCSYMGPQILLFSSPALIYRVWNYIGAELE